MNRFEYLNASTLASAQSQLKADGSVVLKAGGIDLLDLMKERLIQPSRLVHIKSITSLDFIQFDSNKGLLLGPNVTLSRVAQDGLVKTHGKALAMAADVIATPQIRNVATLAGNLCQRPRCWYFRNEDFHCLKKGGDRCYAQLGDNTYHAVFHNTACAIVHPSAAAVALVALGAQIQLQDGTKSRVLPIESFFAPPEVNIQRENVLKPTEIITQIQIPANMGRTRNLYIKQKQKQSFDWPLAELAISAEIEQNRCKSIRIVLGAAAPVPWRAKSVESALTGQTLDASTIQKAAKHVRDGARVMTHNAYKLDLFETLVAQALQDLAQEQPSSPSSKPAPR